MSTTNAGERKRTVTIVIGPMTEAALLRWGLDLSANTPTPDWSLTDMVNVLLRIQMHERIERGSINLPKTWATMRE